MYIYIYIEISTCIPQMMRAALIPFEMHASIYWGRPPSKEPAEWILVAPHVGTDKGNRTTCLSKGS
jgi:hypothetical protein